MEFPITFTDRLANCCSLSTDRWTMSSVFHIASLEKVFRHVFFWDLKFSHLPVKISPVVVLKAAPTAKLEYGPEVERKLKLRGKLM